MMVGLIPMLILDTIMGKEILMPMTGGDHQMVGLPQINIEVQEGLYNLETLQFLSVFSTALFVWLCPRNVLQNSVSYRKTRRHLKD